MNQGGIQGFLKLFNLQLLYLIVIFLLLQLQSGLLDLCGVGKLFTGGGTLFLFSSWAILAFWVSMLLEMLSSSRLACSTFMERSSVSYWNRGVPTFTVSPLET